MVVKLYSAGSGCVLQGLGGLLGPREPDWSMVTNSSGSVEASRVVGWEKSLK